MLTETLEAETQMGLHILEYFLKRKRSANSQNYFEKSTRYSSKFCKQINAIIRAADQANITVTGNTPINWPRTTN